MTTKRWPTRIGRAHRERLLAGIPARERRLELAGVSTAVLEGGDRERRSCCCTARASTRPSGWR